MKTFELKGKKIAEIYVIQQKDAVCLDCPIFIRDNYEDAMTFYQQKRNYFKGWASRENLDFIDEGNYFRLFDKEQNKTIIIVSIRPFRFKLTDKSN